MIFNDDMIRYVINIDLKIFLTIFKFYLFINIQKNSFHSFSNSDSIQFILHVTFLDKIHTFNCEETFNIYKVAPVTSNNTVLYHLSSTFVLNIRITKSITQTTVT